MKQVTLGIRDMIIIGAALVILHLITVRATTHAVRQLDGNARSVQALRMRIIGTQQVLDRLTFPPAVAEPLRQLGWQVRPSPEDIDKEVRP